jgi:hypothetical protein
MKNLFISIFLTAVTGLSAQTMETFNGTWECEYNDTKMGVFYNKENNWLEITTFTPSGNIDFVEIYVIGESEIAEDSMSRRGLYKKSLVYKRVNVKE